jgi:hypothetical protein
MMLFCAEVDADAALLDLAESPIDGRIKVVRSFVVLIISIVDHVHCRIPD